MANTFKNAVLNNTTTATTIYTVPATTTTVVVGLIVANDSGTDTTLTVSLYKSATTTTVNLINAEPLPAASNTTVLAYNNRLVMMTGDYIQITAANAVDSVISVMEIT